MVLDRKTTKGFGFAAQFEDWFNHGEQKGCETMKGLLEPNQAEGVLKAGHIERIVKFLFKFLCSTVGQNRIIQKGAGNSSIIKGIVFISIET